MILRIARIGWVVVVTAALLMYAAGVVVHYNMLRQVCTLPPQVCGEFDIPTATGAAQLDATGMSLETYALLAVGFRLAYSVLPIGLGLLIYARKRDAPLGLVVSLFLITFGMPGGPMSLLGITTPALSGFAKLIEYVGTISLPLFFGLFPNGRMVPRLYWLVVVYFGGAYVIGDITRWDMVNDPVHDFISYTMWLSALLGGVAAQVYRYLRVSTADEKRQTRWVLFGMGLMAVGLVTLLAVTEIIGDPTLATPYDPNLVRRLVFLVIGNLIFQVVYVFIGIAILRSKLFDIDVIIRRTLTYTLVTALLAIVFFGSVVLLQQLFAGITGAGQNELVTVLSTLAIAALFVPLRNRVQDVIDRRFNRKKYDAQKVLNDFANTVRDETNLEKLTGRLIEVVDDTMQPRSVSVWLKKHSPEGNRD